MQHATGIQYNIEYWPIGQHTEWHAKKKSEVQ
jgi:hypothetical protein